VSFRLLRSVSRPEMKWRHVLAGWRSHGVDAELAMPVHVGHRMGIIADNGAWRAWIDPREWLCQQLPELAAMASAACDTAKIAALFNALPRPLTFEHGALPYQRLQAVGIADMPPATLAPRLAATECTVWLTELAETGIMQPAKAGSYLAGMTLPVEWIIGNSNLPPALAPKLVMGDVLLINDITRRLRCQGTTIGTFWQNDEMMMMNEEYDDDGLDMQDPEDFAATTLPDTLTPVPLKVEFILQRRHLTLGELQHLYAGKVMEMDPSSEKHIEIRANGQLIAKGELVQLEDRLGVEITELQMEHSDGK